MESETNDAFNRMIQPAQTGSAGIPLKPQKKPIQTRKIVCQCKICNAKSDTETVMKDHIEKDHHITKKKHKHYTQLGYLVEG